MWLYNLLQAWMPRRAAQVVTTLYYAVVLFLVLLFAFQPIVGFEYAQL